MLRKIKLEMNKRKYPYGADMCPQLKMHVGDKQIANGVLRSSKMSEIYEKTRLLLFRGSAASFEPAVRSATIDKIPRDSRPSKQLQLTFDGKLFKSDLTNRNSNTHDDDQRKCNFCSQTKQLDFCGICKDVFCNMCSLSLCNDEVNVICLTCYK